MSGEPSSEGLHFDSDWKMEAAQEKERLAEREKSEPRPTAAGEASPVNFFELINLLAMQAAIGLGGLQDPGGPQIPPNPMAAKHSIDLLEVLQQKTEGNLTDDEKRVLSTVLYELRGQYVQVVSAPPLPPAGSDEGKTA